MRNMRHSRLLVFVLAAVLFVAAAIPVYAAMASRNITVYTGVRIFVDGRELEPIDVKGNEVEAFIYDGTTYVPLRAVSEALDANVGWNSEKKTVYINSDNSDADPEDRIARFDAGSGYFTYNCGPMTLSSPYCTTDLDGFTIVYSELAFGDPIFEEGKGEHRVNQHYSGDDKARLYELHAVFEGTVKRSDRSFFLCYAHCYDADGKLLRIEKIYHRVEENVPFKLWVAIDIPADTARLVISGDRMD